MKKRKNNLDEMQEQKLLQIEHTGFWIAFWGLFASICAKVAMGHSDFSYIGNETLLLTALSLYMVISCIRNGIWDRKLKPNFKTNITLSLGAGLLVGGFWFVISYHNYHRLAGSIATFFMMFLSISVLSLVLLSLTSALCKRKRRQLDNPKTREEDEE